MGLGWHLAGGHADVKVVVGVAGRFSEAVEPERVDSAAFGEVCAAESARKRMP